MNLLINLNKELQSNTKPMILRVGDLLSVKMRYSKSMQKYNSFTGVCIALKNKQYSSSITLRGTVNKQTVEKQIPIYSSLIDSIKIVNTKVVKSHKSKLYYLRNNMSV